MLSLRFYRIAALSIPIVLSMLPSLAMRPPATMKPKKPGVKVTSGLGDVSPVNSGPGVIVGEPLPVQTTEPLTAFGAGCGRWMSFVFADNPELGKTPLWRSFNRARKELRKPDMRWTLAEAVRTADIIGTTHAAIGEIKGTADHCTLSYSLYALATQQPLGASVTTTGSELEVVAALPGMARTLLKLLGVATPHVPETVGATAGELTDIGRFPTHFEEPVTTAMLARMKDISTHFPVAGLLLLQPGVLASGATYKVTALRTLAQAPDNPLVHAEVTSGRFIKVQGERLAPMIARYPNNLLFALASYSIQPGEASNASMRKAALHLVQCSPHNSSTWRKLADTISQEADAIRNARLIDEMSSEETAAINKIYPLWQDAATRAARTDPLDVEAWRELSAAATFNGDLPTADAAIWKAIKLAPTDLALYNWGLEIYQPKWYDNPQKLADVAHMAAAQHYSDPWSASNFAKGLFSMGFPDDAKNIISTMMEDGRKAIQHNPDDAMGHYQVGLASYASKKPDDAVREFQNVVRLEPNNAWARLTLALGYNRLGRMQDVIGVGHDMLALNSENGAAYETLGELLAAAGQNDEAQKQIETAIRCSPEDPVYHYNLGSVLSTKNDHTRALEEFKAALQKSYEITFIDAVVEEFVYQRQFDEAFALAKRALKMPYDFQLHRILVFAYFEKGDFANCIKQCHIVLDTDEDEYAHVYLGRSLLAEGFKLEAREELKKALDMNGQFKQTAQQALDSIH